jgi:hypothetical protein
LIVSMISASSSAVSGRYGGERGAHYLGGWRDFAQPVPQQFKGLRRSAIQKVPIAACLHINEDMGHQLGPTNPVAITMSSQL